MRQAEAIRKAKELELSPMAHMLKMPSSAAPMFGEYAREYCIWHEQQYPDSHERVQQIIEQHLLPWLEWIPLDRIAVRDAEAFKMRRKLAAKDHTVAKEIRTLHAVINRAVREGLLDRNPIATVAAPRILDAKPHRFYEADELERLYAAACRTVNGGEGPQPNPIMAPIIKLLANTGCRRGEALALKWQWIGKEEMKIVSTGEERTKSGHWREIPLSAGANQAIDVLRQKRVDSVRVLPAWSAPGLSRAFSVLARRSHVSGSLHTLRHTYISHLVRAGTPLRTVQVYAGHAHITTTEQYAYLSPGRADQHARELRL